MKILNLFKSSETLQKEMNQEFASINLLEYKKIETKVTADTDEERQKLIASLEPGDVLKILQYRNRGKMSIDVFLPNGKQIGRLLQDLVDDLTFKKEYGPEPDDDDDEKWFWTLKGYPVVREVTVGKTGRKKLTAQIDFYYKKK